MKFKTFFIGLVGFFILPSCEQEPPALPAETQKGLGTFGCLINGELVIQESQRWLWSPDKREACGTQDTAGRFTLVANLEFGHTFRLFVSQPQLGQNVIDSVFFWMNSGHYYVARNVQQVYFTRFDNNIASGTFAFDANCYDRHTHELIPNKKIQVRKGRFDVRIGPCWHWH